MLSRERHIDTATPMRLCYVGWADQVHLERWAGYFARAGHQVSVVSFTGKGDYPPGVIQRTIGLDRRGPRWKELKLNYLLWDLKPDLVHVHWAHYAPSVKRVWDGPTIVTSYGSDIHRLGEQPKRVQADIVDGLRQVDVITCDSRDTQARIRDLTGQTDDRVRVIQWGVDARLFSPGTPDPALFRSLVGRNRPVVYSARNFTPLYNLDVVLNAFKIVLEEFRDALLLMKYNSGTPEYRTMIEDRIAADGFADSVHIVETMPYERIPDLLRMANVMVSIPSSDSTPMSLLEAMASGVPPIVSDLPALREWITDGWNGYLVSPRDTQAVAARIIETLRNGDIAKGFAARNLEIVKQRASQDTNMLEVARVYRQLASRAVAA